MRSVLALTVFAFSAIVFAVSPARAGTIIHKVVSGDSLWSIAARYHLAVAALEARNHLNDSSVLQLGQFIAIGRSPSRTSTAARPALAPAVTLIDDALDVALGGKHGRRLLAGQPAHRI